LLQRYAFILTRTSPSKNCKVDDFVKSLAACPLGPRSARELSLVSARELGQGGQAGVPVSTPLSSGFARLECEAFYLVVHPLTF